MNNLRYLNDETLASLGISTEDIVTAIETTLLEIQNNRVAVAPKTGVSTTDGRYLMATLSASDDSGIVAVKSVIANKHNPDNGFPAVNGGVMLLDSESGQLLAVLDANWITAVRTAGLSLVAAKRLADPNSHTIGLIGAGVQAQSHLRAFADSFPLKQVRIVGRSDASIQKIKTIASGLKLSCESTDIATCLRESDIVVSAVTRDQQIQPFADAGLMKAGSFATMVDLAIPWHPDTLAGFGQLYVDDMAQERVMDKPIVEPELITGDLSNLLLSEPASDSTQTTAFIFRGIAAGDLAVASLCYQRVMKQASLQK